MKPDRQRVDQILIFGLLSHEYSLSPHGDRVFAQEVHEPQHTGVNSLSNTATAAYQELEWPGQHVSHGKLDRLSHVPFRLLIDWFQAGSFAGRGADSAAPASLPSSAMQHDRTRAVYGNDTMHRLLYYGAENGTCKLKSGKVASFSAPDQQPIVIESGGRAGYALAHSIEKASMIHQLNICR